MVFASLSPRLWVLAALALTACSHSSTPDLSTAPAASVPALPSPSLAPPPAPSLAAAPSASAAAAPSSSSNASAAGAPCSPPAANAHLARSPDGRVTVFVQTDPSRTEVPGDYPHEDLCIQRAGTPPHVLLAGRSAAADAGVEHTLAELDDLLFSRDGTVLYFSSAAWATSSAAHSVDIDTGKERFLVDGVVTATLDEGPYKGMLLVASARLDSAHPVGSPKYRGRMEVWSVVTPDGKTVRTLPEDEAERRRVLGQALHLDAGASP